MLRAMRESARMKRSFLMGLGAALALLLAGCDSGTLWKDEQYAVVWIDTQERILIFRRDGEGDAVIYRAGPTILSVGSNSQVLAFTLKPTGNSLAEPCPYFVIQKESDGILDDPSEVVIGPICDLEEYLEANGFPSQLELEEISAFVMWPFSIWSGSIAQIL